MAHSALRNFLLFLFFISVSVITASAQNTISIPNPDTTFCSGGNITLPVMTGAVQDVDSISLIIQYSSNTLSYLGYREVQSPLRNNGTFDVTQINNSTLRFNWVANEGILVNVNEGKLFELQFSGGTQSGDIDFDETQSLFRDINGNPVSTIYSGTPVNLFPVMSIVIEEIDQTCPGECDANIAAYATGGVRPYDFTWNGEPSVFDSVLAGACGGVLLISITDANGCSIDTLFDVTELEGIEVEMETDPDTVYIQNPIVKFSFPDDPNVVDWWWDFGDGAQISRDKSPTHLYSGASNELIDKYTAVLYYVNEDGCSDSSSIVIPVAEADVFIPNVFTPNGDGRNEYFQITKVLEGESKVPITDEFIRLELVIIDRWGRKVYDNQDYQNNWNGDNLPEGTYYYRLNVYGYFRDDSYKGSVVILR